MIERWFCIVLVVLNTQIAAQTQGFEFLYASDTAELVRNEFGKVYFQDGNVIGDVKFSSLGFRRTESKLMKFDAKGAVLKKTSRLEDDFQFKFHRGNFKEYNDSLLFSRRFFHNNRDFVNQILLTDKNIENSRILFTDTVNEMRDFT